MSDKFNVDQQRALDNPLNVDLIISAGAGSGKTKTLSEKVMLLIEGGMKPSELLVLTFTNNAAHEMKDRIIAKFKDNKDIAYQMASAHIQTFDSFCQYLVTSYSGRLNIAEQISIIDQEVIETKENAILEEIFDEYYSDLNKNSRFLKTLMKFNLRDDASSKKVVLSIYHNIEKLSKLDQDHFLNHYEETFLSKEFFNNAIHQLVVKAKEVIKDNILIAHFLDKNNEAIKDKNILAMESVFNNKNNFTNDVNHLYFNDEKSVQPLYEEILKLLSLDDEDFIEKVKTFQEDNPDLLIRRNVSGHKELRNLFLTTSPGLKFILDLGDLEDEYEKLLYFKDDIALYLDIVKEIKRRINGYKRITNSFTFSDISDMALSLLVDPQYEDVAEEIRSRFKFIMVDEYQDTNNLQEDFINSLIKPNKKGERSHLFCVGDAKQSIYGFRDSNVELFKRRQKLYSEPSKDHNAIPMNRNYRSGAKLLEEINYIFEYYMTLSHGGIPYHQESEMLKYDHEINLYGKPYEHFGIHRIVSTSSLNYDDYRGDPAIWEAQAIARDILNKINSGFKVSVKGQEPRPCDLNDFTILVRRKKYIDVYQKVFSEYGITLNCTVNNNLNEIDSIMVIQSLFNLYLYRLNEETPTSPRYRHTFMSVARSYLFEYKDQDLFDLLYDPKGEYFLLNNDQIILKMDEFIKNHDKKPLSEVFLDLINEFGVIEKLYKIGGVDDVVSKIESLYQMAITQEQAGEGVEQFVRLLEDTKKYNLNLTSESVFKVKKAVDLMTIHGSKGLENKIIYMPCSSNSLSKGGGLNKPDYTFSKELGILLPYYNYEFKNEPINDIGGFNICNSIQQLITSSNEEKEENIDEHVRLFYVALTRAENMVYIVGDPKKLDEKYLAQQKNNETLYGMLLNAPHYVLLNNEFIKRKISEGVVNKVSYDTYLTNVQHMKNIKRHFTSDDFAIDQYDRYVNLWNDYYLNLIYTSILDNVKTIEQSLFSSYFHRFEKEQDDDKVAGLFAIYFFHDTNIKTIDELIVKYRGKVGSNLDEDDEEVRLDIELDSRNVYDLLDRFKNAIIKGVDVEFLGIKAPKTIFTSKEEPTVPFALLSHLLTPFILFYDHENCYKRLSFSTDGYEDKVFSYDYTKDKFFTNNEQKKAVDFDLTIDDTIIDFTIRTHEKASKNRLIDEELPNQQWLDMGIHLHRLLELTDLKIKDTSFIKDKKEQAIIDRVLELDIFKDLDDATIYQEYGYYDEIRSSTGFIDLLIKKGDEFYIIDYKAKHVQDSAYNKQLKTYRDNVKKIFNVDENKIHMYLLSILDHQLYEVK